MGFFDCKKTSPGTLLTRLVNDTAAVNGVVMLALGATTQTVMCVLTALTFGFICEWRLTLINLGFYPFTILSSVIYGNIMRAANDTNAQIDNQAGSILSESVINTKSIFSYTMQRHIVKVYSNILSQKEKSLVKQCMYSGLSFGFSFFIYCLSYAVLFYVGGRYIEDGSITLLDMLTAMLAMSYGSFGIGTAGKYVGDITNAENALLNIFRVIEQPSEIDPFDETKKLNNEATDLEGKIEFRNVSFAYPTRQNKNVYDGLNFTIEPGESAAFVGLSGSGKSTLIGLLQKFYNISGGEILIDGKSIDEYNLMSLRKMMSLVSQEPVLFKLSNRENIRYGNLEAYDHEVFQAAEFADVVSLVSGERAGSPISGGDKLRIAIARAVLRRPKIILLDEATSALDRETEGKIQKYLDQMMVGKTSIVVAHK